MVFLILQALRHGYVSVVTKQVLAAHILTNRFSLLLYLIGKTCIVPAGQGCA
jgi:hypothetical protein